MITTTDDKGLQQKLASLQQFMPSTVYVHLMKEKTTREGSLNGGKFCMYKFS